MNHKNRTSGRNGDISLKKYNNPKLAIKYILTSLDFDIFCNFVRDKTVKDLVKFYKKTSDAIFFSVRKVGEEYLEFYDHSIGTSMVDNFDKIIFQDFVYGASIDHLIEEYVRQPQEIFMILRKVGLLYEQYYQTFKKKRKILE